MLKETLENVLLGLRIVYWVIMIGIVVVGFLFVKHTTDTISTRLDNGQAPFSLDGLINTKELAQDVVGQVGGEQSMSGPNTTNTQPPKPRTK